MGVERRLMEDCGEGNRGGGCKEIVVEVGEEVDGKPILGGCDQM